MPTIKPVGRGVGNVPTDVNAANTDGAVHPVDGFGVPSIVTAIGGVIAVPPVETSPITVPAAPTHSIVPAGNSFGGAPRVACSDRSTIESAGHATGIGVGVSRTSTQETPL